MLAITRDEREVLRRELDWYHGHLEDLTNCVKLGRPDLRLRWRAHIALSLLDDLGWEHDDAREEFHLTLAYEELAHWLRVTLEETDRYIAEKREHLAAAHGDAIAERRYLVVAGHSAASVAQLEAGYRDETLRDLDEALELRLVATRLIGRLGDG